VHREDAPVKLVFAVVDIIVARDSAAERGGAVNPVDREWEFEGVMVGDGPVTAMTLKAMFSN
jgi:hypothetical protein